jgi:AcrR family transcriptional regulator
MSDLGGKAGGVRGRRRQQTRAKLLDAAIDLSDRQGFEQTTVEQIGEAANLSARTFTHFFPTKAAVILELVQYLTVAVNAELRLVPLDVKPLPALLAANIGVLRRAKKSVGPMTPDRIAGLLRMANTSPTRQRLAIDFRSAGATEVLAQRMQMGVDDPRVRLTAAVWAAIIVSAWGDLGASIAIEYRQPDNIPDLMYQRLVDTFASFTRLAGETSYRGARRDGQSGHEDAFR